MRRPRRVRLLGCAVALGCACVASACLFPSLDSLTGSSDAAADVPADQTLADGAAPDADAALTDADAAAKPFSCSQVDAKFCDDFDDEGGATFAHWSSAYIVNGGDAGLAPSDASPPFAALFTTPSTPGTAPYALLHREFTGVITTSAHLGFDLRVDEYPSSSLSIFSTGGIALSTGNGGGIGLDLGEGTSALQESVFPPDGGADYPTMALTSNVPLGKWVHIDIVVTIGNGLATVQVLFDGQTVLAPTNLDGRIPWGTPELTMGETYVDPANDGTAFLTDDVTFDFQ